MSDDPTTVRTTKTTQKFDTAEDVADIVEAIKSKEDTLETISLEGNSYGIEPLRAIGEALSMCPRLKHLLMNDMFISRLKTEIPEALRLMFAGVMASGAKIETLNLNDNAIGPVTMPQLLPFLQSDSCASLKVLRLNNCGLGIGGGTMLSKVLPCLEQLEELIIGRNRLEIDGIRDISQALLKLSNLQVLELPQNGTKGAGIVALSQAIDANRGLRILNLNDNILKGQGPLLASALAGLNRLEVLNFGDCLLKTAGCVAILTAVQNLASSGVSTIRELILNGNEIGKSAGPTIISAIENVMISSAQPELPLKVDLSSNNLGEDLIEQLVGQFSSQAELIIDDDEGSGDEDEGGENEADVTGQGGDDDESQDAKQNGYNDQQQDEEIVDVEKLVALYESSYTSVSALCAEFFRATSKGIQSDSSLSERALAQIEALVKVGLAHQNAKIHFELANSLLVSCGLLKGEDKSLMPAKGQDLAGPLLGLGASLKFFTNVEEKKCIRSFLQKTIDDPQYERIKSNLYQFIYRF